MSAGNSDIILVYFVGTVSMLLLAAGIFFFFITYQKRLLQKELEINRVIQNQQEEILQNTVEAQEKERKRIARDLHDEVGTMLSVVKLNVGRIERKATEDSTKGLAGETKSYLDDVITQVRRISRALLPPSLEKLGLYYAIEDLMKWVGKSDELQIVCHKSGEQFRFDINKELALFRVVQELINNSIKYAEASELVVQLSFKNNGIGIIVADNGNGFILEEKKNLGLGLRNLESRIKMAGAKWKMKTNLGKGTRAIIFLKFSKNE